MIHYNFYIQFTDKINKYILLDCGPLYPGEYNCKVCSGLTLGCNIMQSILKKYVSTEYCTGRGQWKVELH